MPAVIDEDTDMELSDFMENHYDPKIHMMAPGLATAWFNDKVDRDVYGGIAAPARVMRPLQLRQPAR